MFAGGRSYDAVVVGSGPNGLAAAIELARNGLSVAVLEAAGEPGGALRSAETTLPGFVHDVGSAIHPLAVASPFFRSLSLERYGVRWVHPPAPLAHPLEGEEVVLLERSLEETAAGLGEDGEAYLRLMSPLAADLERLANLAAGRPALPRHPAALGASALRALRPAVSLARAAFRGGRARALFAGNAAHSFLPLERRPSALFGLALGALGHAVGWPFPEGGAGRLARALVSCLRALGGELLTGFPVGSLEEVPPARAVLFDVTPRQLLRIAGERLPGRYRRALARYRYGPGAFKVDFALDGPIPWADGRCARAGTVHLGGALEEIAAGEREVWRGGHPERPFVLLAQHTLFDPSRAPEGRHTVWAYCHVPNGSTFDMTGRIERQIERFAPGFRERVLTRRSAGPADLERENPNLVGGDINGGVMDLGQLLTRPARRLDPYSTPVRGLYICSSSTPPGGGVHGLCGYLAARSALRLLRGSRRSAPRPPAARPR
ncbi:phytoene desaturase family protein [Rubrobacter xylanophilus]|uniref:phytoene desaturase family protein n=1 Tax=Rubrobacter xylanophilus TaxID=49319 RepID=UPI00117B42C9|nr:NAD(P)/FAD-dependent oxidoreductase [Rubrobacter xylanophilus]